MKIGFSFGKCVNDIALGVVDIRDVLVIIAATKIDKIESIRPVIQAYVSDGYITADFETAAKIGETLFYNGRIHQPRQYRAFIPHTSHRWFDVIPSVMVDDPNAEKALEDYRMMIKLITGADLPHAEISVYTEEPRTPEETAAILKDIDLLGF